MLQFANRCDSVTRNGLSTFLATIDKHLLHQPVEEVLFFGLGPSAMT